jgi:hypothetical protein
MRWSAVDLELLAMRTPLDELVYKVCESRPEVVTLNSGSGGLLSGVSGSGKVVIESGDFSAKIGVVGDVGGSFIGKNRSFFGRYCRPSFCSWLRGDFRMGFRDDLLRERIGYISLDKLSSESGVVDSLVV